MFSQPKYFSIDLAESYTGGSPLPPPKIGNTVILATTFWMDLMLCQSEASTNVVNANYTGSQEWNSEDDVSK